MVSSSCVRIAPQELAQLQTSIQTLDLPSRQACSTAKAERYERKFSLPRRKYDYITFCLGSSELKGVIVADFELASKSIVLDGKGDLFLPAPSGRCVLLWKGRVVIPEDLLREVLQYCHKKSDHGDFSRTLAIVKEYYTFVPSSIVRDFVDACPTCAAKRGSKEDPWYIVTDRMHNTGNVCFSNSFDLLAISDSQDDELSALSTSSPFIFSGLTLESNVPTNVPAPPPLFSRLSTASGKSHDGLPQSLPMSREVSLFQGIPNGWQYFTDYDVAHKDFLEHKDEVMSQQLKPEIHQKRPRIPSIAPLRSANFNTDEIECTGLDKDV